MLFSENMCFFRRQKPIPQPIINISAPLPRVESWEKAPVQFNPVAPYERSYSVHTVSNAPMVPPKAYSHKHSLRPDMPQPEVQPVWNRQWSFAGDELRTSSSAAPGRAGQKQRKPSIWTPHSNGEKRRMFSNAGFDEEGRLKLEYEEVQDTDWGEPDDYLPIERRPSYWQ